MAKRLSVIVAAVVALTMTGAIVGSRHHPAATATVAAQGAKSLAPRALGSTSTWAKSAVQATSTSMPTTTTTIVKRLDFRAFDRAIQSATVDIGDMSVGVAVMRDGVLLHAADFGMESPFEGKQATPATRFRIASVSKMFTAVVIMQLSNEHRIDLDKSFTQQLGMAGPFDDPRVETITVRQLLSHTSGFPVSRGLYFKRGVETWQDAAHTALTLTLQSDPGTAFQYSNTNFCELGLLIESVTGQPFESVIRDRVLQPLGIDAHMAPTADTQPGDALHVSGPTRNYMEALGPAGAWVATPTGIATLAASLRTDVFGVHLLDAASVAAMRTPITVLPPADDWTYGLGLRLFADGSWGHSGTVESAHAMVVNRPDGLTIAVLTSGEVPGNTDDLLGVIDHAIASAYAS
jgi:D-alanyl-D-alanine carboxypeptidase